MAGINESWFIFWLRHIAGVGLFFAGVFSLVSLCPCFIDPDLPEENDGETAMSVMLSRQNGVGLLKDEDGIAYGSFSQLQSVSVEFHAWKKSIKDPLSRALKTVKVALNKLDDKEVLRMLKEAKKQNIQVSVLTSTTEAQTNFAFLSSLNNDGITTLFHPRGPVHNFMIFDDEKVCTSVASLSPFSENFVTWGLNVVCSDPDVVKGFLLEYETLCEQTRDTSA